MSGFIARVFTRRGIVEVEIDGYKPTIRLWEPTGELRLFGDDPPGVTVRTYESQICSDGSVIYTEVV